MFRMIWQITDIMIENKMSNISNIGKYISTIWQYLFITIMIISNNMNLKNASVLDILKAVSMQISIWRWEMHMISKYGFDWGYKDLWCNEYGGTAVGVSPQSWMNLSMEKTPVRSSTLRPYSAWRPLRWLMPVGGTAWISAFFLNALLSCVRFPPQLSSEDNRAGRDQMFCFCE